jgi:DNA repair photolyase
MGVLMLKGRGASSNKTSRFNAFSVERQPEYRPQKLDTLFYREHAKSIITRNASPDVPFDFSINPYRGCEHGCVYCFARPNHAYVNLSPGLDFESRIFYKHNAAQVLERELNRPGYVPSPITIGTATDPYQPVESSYEITRQIIAVLVRYRHPFSIITKSQMVSRDIDLLKQAARLNLVKVMMSVTTLNNSLKAKLEPRTASGQARLKVIRALTANGIPVGVLIAPLIPWLNDHETESIIQESKAAGAESANYILLRLPREVAPLFVEWLQLHYPDREQRVLNAIRQTRGGKLYKSDFTERMRGTGEFASMYRQRFMLACKKEGIDNAFCRSLDCSQFSLPCKNNQLALF